MNVTPLKHSAYANLNTIAKSAGARNYLYMQSPLKCIAGNTCACCGQKMLTRVDISKIWSTITLPLKEVLPNYRWEKVKNNHPDLFNTITYLANKFPKKALSDIILEKPEHVLFMDAIANSVDRYRCTRNLSPHEYREYIKSLTMGVLNTSACILKDAKDVIPVLKPYESYMRGHRKEIFNELEYQSSKYPDKKIFDIIRMPELSEKYIENTYYEAVNFAKKRDYHWERADKIILRNKPELKDEIKKLRTRVAQAYGSDDEKRVAYQIQELYRIFLKEHNLNHLEKNVLGEICQIPLLTFTKNSFLSYPRRYYSDGLIVQYIIRPFMETVKSIVPPKKGGYELSNKILVCRECGDNLAQIPYTETALYHPEMIKNTEKQLQFIGNKILDGTLPSELFDYPIAFSKTLYNYSGGLINPDLSNYIENIKNIKL